MYKTIFGYMCIYIYVWQFFEVVLIAAYFTRFVMQKYDS